MDNRPIGVFDSGLGGLTGVKELRKRLPHENIVYFGDTGRVPYGSRSPETILQYARQDIAFLLSQNVKCIMAACGTVSSTSPAAEAAKPPQAYSIFSSLAISLRLMVRMRLSSASFTCSGVSSSLASARAPAIVTLALTSSAVVSFEPSRDVRVALTSSEAASIVTTPFLFNWTVPLPPMLLIVT